MDFVTILSIFVLACFVGYYVVWSVTPALHTPLMAVTNAVSSVIIVGALIAAAAAESPAAKWLGLLGVVLARVNIFGGFAVTERMLAGYKKKERKEVAILPPDTTTDLSTVAAAATAVNPWVALAYLVAGVCFILALRGLSSPESSRRGKRFGMAGMLIAVVTTLVTHDIASLPEIVGAIAIGGIIGFVIARRIAMTAMPQLVAAFHSLVGLAAVLVAAAAFFNPGAFDILGLDGNILVVSRIEMALGAAIGAITFSGSVIAFAK